jgi:hypothetical protein
MKSKKAVKKTAPTAPGLAVVAGQAAPAHEMPTQDLTVDASATAAAPTSISAEHSKPNKKDRPAKTKAKLEKLEKQAKEAKKPLNFKVSSDFRREFKTYASAHDLKLSKLLELAFESFRKHDGD